MDAADLRLGKIQGIVLAGSYPWSDSALERLRPRPLLPVAHRPLVGYALRWLQEGGVRRVTFCANAATRGALARFTDGAFAGLDLEYSEDPTPRGPAGCARDAALRGDADTLVVADGTAIPTIPLAPILAGHWRSGAALTVVVHQEPARGSAPGMQTPSGIYVFARHVLASVPDLGFHDIKEHLIPRLYRAGEPVVTHVAPGACPRVLNAQTYLAVNHWMVEHLVEHHEPLRGYAVVGGLMAHGTARIGMDAVFAGPVVVGPRATVLSGATIVGPAVIGEGSTVGRGALVSRSVTWRGAHVGRDAVVDRSVLAEDAAVERGEHVLGAVQTKRLRRRAAHAGDAGEPNRFLELWTVHGDAETATS